MSHAPRLSGTPPRLRSPWPVKRLSTEVRQPSSIKVVVDPRDDWWWWWCWIRVVVVMLCSLCVSPLAPDEWQRMEDKRKAKKKPRTRKPKPLPSPRQPPRSPYQPYGKQPPSVNPTDQRGPRRQPPVYRRGKGSSCRRAPICSPPNPLVGRFQTNDHVRTVCQIGVCLKASCLMVVSICSDSRVATTSFDICAVVCPSFTFVV